MRVNRLCGLYTPYDADQPLQHGMVVSIETAMLHASRGWELAPKYIVRDRERIYGEVFTRRLRAMGIRDRPTAPRSPWQNRHTERLIGSIRRECLDHVVVFGEQHLRHLFLSYMQHYNGVRTHLSLNKDAPVSRAVQAIGRILPMSILGGLHHHSVDSTLPSARY